jgi:outer membrane protein
VNKLFLRVSVALLASAVPLAASAFTFAVVEGGRVMQRVEPAVESILKTEFKVREEKLLAEQKDLQKDQQKAMRDGAVMNKTEMAKLQQDFVKKQQQFQQDRATFSEAFMSRKNEELQKRYNKVMDIISSIAKEKKFDVVLRKEALLFVENQTDITEDVIKRYDEISTDAKAKS